MPYTPPDSPDTNDTARQRRYWGIMALLPILVMVVSFWCVLESGAWAVHLFWFVLIATPFWIANCSVKLAVLHEMRNKATVIRRALCYFLLLFCLYAVISTVLVFAGCMVAYNF